MGMKRVTFSDIFSWLVVWTAILYFGGHFLYVLMKK